MNEIDKPKIALHILVIVFLLSIPFFLAPSHAWDHPILENQMLQKDLVIYAFSIIFFYINYLLLVPKFYHQRNRLTYFIWVLVLFIVVCVLPELLFKPEPHLHEGAMAMHPPRHGMPRPSFFAHLRMNVFLFLLSWALSTLYSFSNRLQEAERLQQKAELSNLKAQVNPHFLFNSLNTIYALAISKSDQAADAVLKLSGIMRFVLMEGEKDLIPLAKELLYLRDYIALQKLRIGNEFVVEFSTRIEDDTILLTPFLLMPLVENAFKHGVSQEDISPIKLHLETEGKSLVFTSHNKIVQHTFVDEYPGGLGLENLKLRLDHLYEGKYQLTYENRQGFFDLTLKVFLG